MVRLGLAIPGRPTQVQAIPGAYRRIKTRISWSHMRRKAVSFVFVVGAIVGFVVAVTSSGHALAQQQVIASHQDWRAYRDQEDGQPLCYIGSLPKKEEGDYTSRGDSYVLVTIRPAEKPEGVVTVEAGYAYQESSKVDVGIGDKSFELYTRNRDSDGKGDAWAFGDAGDKALIEAMKAGERMVVKGTSSRGTLTTDTYSLLGFTAAHNAIRDACGRQTSSL